MPKIVKPKAMPKASASPPAATIAEVKPQFEPGQTVTIVEAIDVANDIPLEVGTEAQVCTLPAAPNEYVLIKVKGIRAWVNRRVLEIKKQSH